MHDTQRAAFASTLDAAVSREVSTPQYASLANPTLVTVPVDDRSTYLAGTMSGDEPLFGFGPSINQLRTRAFGPLAYHVTAENFESLPQYAQDAIRTGKRAFCFSDGPLDNCRLYAGIQAEGRYEIRRLDVRE